MRVNLLYFTQKEVKNVEKISDKYYLGSNKNTFVLYERRVSETTGKESYKNLGYIRNLEDVYVTLIEKEVKEDLTILNNISKVNEMIKELKVFTINHTKEAN